jgi:hypothetical protein
MVPEIFFKGIFPLSEKIGWWMKMKMKKVQNFRVGFLFPPAFRRTPGGDFRSKVADDRILLPIFFLEK